MDPEKVSITVTIEHEVELSVSEVWPDRDHPEQITAEAVVAQLESHGNKDRTLRDWNLLDDPQVEVLVTAPNPHHSEDPALFEVEPKTLPWVTTFDVAWEPAEHVQRRLDTAPSGDAGASSASTEGAGK